MKKILAQFTALALLMTLCSGCALLPAEEEPLPVPVSNNPEVSYITTPVARGDLEDTVDFNARFAAIESQDVSFVTAGRVEQIHAQLGDRVEKGDILMELENEDAQFALDKADVQMEIQQMQHDHVTDRNREDSIPYQIADKEMALAQLDYDRLREQVEQSYLYAPLSGVVSYRVEDVTAGDYVEKNVRMYTIADTSSLVAESSFNDVKGLRKGMEVELYMGSVDLSLVGTIAHLPNEKKEGSDDTYGKIIIALPEELQAQIADYYGQSLKATVRLETLRDVLYIPENLVKTSGTSSYLRVLEDGVIVEKTVELGATVKGYVQILSGAEEGDEVVFQR